MEIRQAIADFETAMSKMPGVVFGDSALAPLEHSFADGMYIRKILLRKGTLVTGKIHKHCHPAFIMSGEVSVVTEHTGIERIKGPIALVSKGGTKRLIYVHEDTVWITVHLNPNELRDLDELEKEIIAPSYEELPSAVTRSIL
jgi:hypothetical protein